MNDTTNAPAAPEKTTIRPDLDRYVRAKSGSGKRTHRIDDLTARTLDGKTLEEVKKGADLLGIDHPKWNHLNNGQQRMLIGNAIRKRLSDTKNPLTEQALADVFGTPVGPYDAEKAAAEAKAADEAKAQKAAEAAAKKEAKEKAAAEKAAKRAESAAEGAALAGDGKGQTDRDNGKKAKK